MATLMFTEAIAEARDTKTTPYAACIDASKAFDVVWHNSMLRKLFNLGLDPACWNILNDWHSWTVKMGIPQEKEERQ